jgi:hypothetical protein
MHSVTLSQLQDFEDQATAQGDPQLYLRLLSPLHFLWHTRSPRRVGFLLFHWHVIAHFKAAGLEAPMGVVADTVADFDAGGRFSAAGWTDVMGGVPDATGLGDLESYSRAIEGWHNEAHMVIGDATGLDMMDPRANVFFPEFWGLHYFINAQFDHQLASYAAAVHPQLVTTEQQVGHVEDEHPSTISSI